MGIFLAAMIVPFTTIEVARFSIVNNLGLYNTLWAPILIYVGADLMQIFVYKQFIDKIPESLDESAMLERSIIFHHIYKNHISFGHPRSAYRRDHQVCGNQQ